MVNKKVKKILKGIGGVTIITTAVLGGLVSCGNSDTSNKETETKKLEVSEETAKEEPEKKEDSIEELRKKFVEENKLDIKAIDVKYDIANMVEKNFLIEGKARLDDYFNYEYRDDRKTHFSVKIEEVSGESWNVYFDKKEFAELFESLKVGEQYILVKAIVPKVKYAEGMGALATGKSVFYEKVKLDKEEYIEANELEVFMQKHKIVKTKLDIEYALGDNLDEYFVLTGTAKLDDYYNYSFSDTESKYFNISIDDNQGESWYVYIDRKENKEIFEELKKGPIEIYIKSKLPRNMYKDGMEFMAIGEVVEKK